MSLRPYVTCVVFTIPTEALLSLRLYVCYVYNPYGGADVFETIRYVCCVYNPYGGLEFMVKGLGFKGLGLRVWGFELRR
jgi:hypothetical protein